MSELPRSIGKYRVERVLGVGASGTVYLAYDPFRDKWVAIKQIHAHLLDNPAQASRCRQMLHNESILASQLSHPHIVGLLDVDELADPPYLVLEYVKGRSLESYTSHDLLLPVSDVMDIGFKCCNALDYANQRGLVHRDIKPANLLMGENGELKLTDFGAAYSLHGEVTQIGGLVGSPAYMSPEQIHEQELTLHSDMFSLAVVLYEMLTGQKPFAGETDYATMFKISSEPAVPMRVLRPELPVVLDAVIGKALAKLPADRYATWPLFANALIGVVGSSERMVSHSTDAQRFRKLRGMVFFQEFSDVAIWETLRLGTVQAIGAQGILMEEGSQGNAFYLLLKGQVSVSQKNWALSTLNAGVSLGEMAYLQPEGNVRSATVMALTDIIVLKIQSASLHKASHELQGFFDRAFIKILVERLIASNLKLAELDATS